MNEKNDLNILKNTVKINKLVNALIKEINESDLPYNIISEEMNESHLRYNKISGKLKQLNNQESIVKWFSYSIIKNESTKVRRSILYENYANYCKENGLITMAKKDLFLYIHDTMGRLVKIKGYHYFNGYELKN